MGKHTQLNGAVIASDADAAKNRLSTETLGFTDLKNKADYKSTTVGVNLGMSGAFDVANKGGANKAGPSGFSFGQTSGSDSGTTYAAIAPGTIEVRSDKDSGRDSTAGLSRDTAGANGSIGQIFDKDKVREQLEFQQAFGQLGMQLAGDALKTLKEKDPDLWGEGKPGAIGLHAAVAGIAAALGGGSVAGAIGGTVAGDIASNLAQDQIASAVAGLPDDVRDQVSRVITNVVAGAVGGAVGGMSGAGGAAVADMFNRQLHPQEKDLALEIVATARKRGIVNPDGTSISVEQIEGALRSADNKTYGELASSGMIVPLTGTMSTGALYDTTGMILQSDGSGKYWLVQSPSAFLNPPDHIRKLIMETSGGAESPYDWNAPSPGSQRPVVVNRYDAFGPFSPGWNTGDYSAGLPRSDFRSNPDVIFQAGFHVPASAGVGAGYNFSINNGDYSVKPDFIVGSFYDAGASIGIYGDAKYSGPAVVNIGPGIFALQVTPSNPAAWDEKPWYVLSRYINGVAVGVGVGKVAPINVTVDPTYISNGGNK